MVLLTTQLWLEAQVSEVKLFPAAKTASLSGHGRAGGKRVRHGATLL